SVIPNAVDHLRFRPDVDGSRVRESLHVPAGTPLLLLVGRIVPHKGVEHFIEAARYVPEARFVIAGGGSLLEPMRALAESMGVADRVQFLGRVSDEQLPEVYAACDVFVLPSVSRLEAFGILALHAMGARAREKVLESFSIEQVTDRIEAAYRAVLDDAHIATG